MDFGMELFPLFLVIFRQWQGRESPKYLRYEFLLAFLEYMFYNIPERIFELGGENLCQRLHHRRLSSDASTSKAITRASSASTVASTR